MCERDVRDVCVVRDVRDVGGRSERCVCCERFGRAMCEMRE